MWGDWLKKMFSEWGWRRNEDGGSGKWPRTMLHNQASTGLGQAGIEVELSEYQRLSGGDEELSPRNLLQGERANSEVIADLDAFFERLYKYYCGKGLWCIVTQWVVELLSLGFTICFSGFFLLIVDWQVLRTCGVHAIEPCDLVREAVKEHPLNPFTFSKGIVVTYLSLFSLYWIFCFLRFFTQLRETLDVRNFYHHRLRVSDRELQTSAWPALLDKIVKFQQHQRLCVVRELSAHDVVMRIMRRENYLIGMLNKGVLAVPLPAWVPGSGPLTCHDRDGTGRRLLLTKTLEWSLNWCILQHMFDRSFLVRKDFINNPTGLRRRLMGVGFVMLLLSPFLIIFMFVYFFLRHAEEFYHHPSTVTSRRWSNLAKWIFREFNEMDHMFSQRLNCSYKHAVEYMKQFPSMIISLLAKFVSFVAGGFAAIFLIIAFLDESLLEAHIFGRNLLWFAAVFGTITAISRSAIIEEFQVSEPEKSLRLVAWFTHYMPKHWRGAENKDNVRADFESLFQYTGMTLIEELLSIFVTPYTLFFLLPKYVEDVLQFIRDFTVHIDGVGDVCSLSVFDFEHHGNRNYGSPFHTNKARRSCQGKMEKSFLSFRSSYPHWEPDFNGKRFLSILADFQVQSTEPHLANVSPSLQPARPCVPRLDNSMFSLLMQPGYGFKWPLSCSSSAQEQGQSGQFREDHLFWGNKLVPDQLYWLVDRFYTFHSCQIGFREASDREGGNQDNEGHPSYRVDSSPMSSRMHLEESIIQRVNMHVGASDHTAYDQHLDFDRIVAGQATSLSSMSKMQQEENLMDKEEVLLGASDDAVYKHLNTQKNVLGQTSVFPKHDEGNQQWLQQGQPSAMATGSFLEPPIYGAGHFAGSSYESFLDNEGDQERSWDLLHSRRAYTNSTMEEVSDFDLPFGDFYDAPQGLNKSSQS